MSGPPPGPGGYGQQPGGMGAPPGGDLRSVRPQADNDKLLGALCYIFLFLVPIIILATDMKNSRFAKVHAYQGIVFGAVCVAFYIVAGICWTIATSIFFLLACIVGFLWLIPLAVGLYFAFLVYTKDAVVLPGVTDATKAIFKDL
jgi:uncharacterized membrane protein